MAGGSEHAAHHPRLGVDADVVLRPPSVRMTSDHVPLVALRAEVHLGVARLVLVSSEGGRSSQGGVDHRARFEEQAALAQQRVDSGQNLPLQFVLFHAVAKAQAGRSIAQALHLQTHLTHQCLQNKKCIVKRKVIGDDQLNRHIDWDTCLRISTQSH